MPPDFEEGDRDGLPLIDFGLLDGGFSGSSPIALLEGEKGFYLFCGVCHGVCSLQDVGYKYIVTDKYDSINPKLSNKMKITLQAPFFRTKKM